ncbi:G-protein beta WD-40 repeat containing protein [Cardiosporidium cionae]|uniref:G-protein beta WD-40 repeat containing protein n=1 Tax=Cardiosporidium cionae TaxID=476202 RepID=A0ABQ7JBY3_9APIC|nr:G-protein beta WD-40 repeat containing protein [Cardiosporidium cionae]|eukprot:KAF8821399.1 G-protein beta WD-40 repeat containing protein [Cardiosporidium cionae]
MEYLKSYNFEDENEAEQSSEWTSISQSTASPTSDLPPTVTAVTENTVSLSSDAVKDDSVAFTKTTIPLKNGTNFSSESIPASSVMLPSLNSAPDVLVPLSLLTHSPTYHLPTDTVIYTNPTVDCLTAPIQGPLTPLQESQGGFSRQLQNHITGNVEPLHINTISFYEQFHSYENRGITANPSDAHEMNSASFILLNDEYPADNSARSPVLSSSKTDLNFMSTEGFSDNRFIVAREIEGGRLPPKVDTFTNERASNLTTSEYFPAPVSSRREERRKRKHPPEIKDPSSEVFMGPWAKRESQKNTEASLEIADPSQKGEENTTNATESSAVSNSDAPKNSEKITPSGIKKNEEKVTTIFHGKTERDYQGRSWIDFPVNFKEPPMDHQNYLPKTSIYTYVGHTMGVHAIRFFPTSGHLLLSAGLDSQVKIWDCYNQRLCLRTFLGHELGVRDIQFTHDGHKFYSCSYDKNIQLWDTEYGKIIGTFSNGSIPYCVSPHPEPDQEHIFIIGSANKRAVQFDSKSGQIVQEYNEHLAAVNSVTFCENGRKLVTTSDDKKVFIWDYGIPVVVKHIAEPSMHSMPSVCVHPSKKFLAAQSMDNKIVVYEAFGRFRFQGRKQFRGHGCSGYAIHPGFSPDGRYIMSGDAGGKLWFWDWKNMKNYRTLQCHHGVCIDCAWHPTMSSRVATCGWDGLIKLWD